MKFLLDSYAIIALMKGNSGFLRQLRQHQPQDFGLPAIVVLELFYGAYKGLRIAQNVARVEVLQFQIVDFDREDARRAGEIRAKLAASGTPIGPYEVLIAGQALARALTVITHNTREFQSVPGLLMEDWELFRTLSDRSPPNSEKIFLSSFGSFEATEPFTRLRCP